MAQNAHSEESDVSVHELFRELNQQQRLYNEAAAVAWWPKMQFLVSGEQVDELMAAMYACMQRNTQEKKYWEKISQQFGQKAIDTTYTYAS
jgi:hypothetical protein